MFPYTCQTAADLKANWKAQFGEKRNIKDLSATNSSNKCTFFFFVQWRAIPVFFFSSLAYVLLSSTAKQNKVSEQAMATSPFFILHIVPSTVPLTN